MNDTTRGEKEVTLQKVFEDDGSVSILPHHLADLPGFMNALAKPEDQMTSWLAEAIIKGGGDKASVPWHAGSTTTESEAAERIAGVLNSALRSQTAWTLLNEIRDLPDLILTQLLSVGADGHDEDTRARLIALFFAIKWSPYLCIHGAIRNLRDLMASFNGTGAGRRWPLYRGQQKEWELLPSVARNRASLSTPREQNAIEELRKRHPGISAQESDLEVLALAQHHGMKTRLLDWTENVLTALWFACEAAENIAENPRGRFLYRFMARPEIKASDTVDPFSAVPQVQVYRPNWHNERVAAQQSIFTLHRPEDGAWVSLVDLTSPDDNFGTVSVTRIPETSVNLIKIQLTSLGVSEERLFPGLEGTCRFLNGHCRLGS